MTSQSCKKPTKEPTELRIQADCFQWHWNTYPKERKLMFMVNNTPRSQVNGARMIAAGMVKGAADLCYLQDGRPPVFIEMKTGTGKQSAEQIEWQRLVEETGALYRICRSLDEFKALIISLH